MTPTSPPSLPYEPGAGPGAWARRGQRRRWRILFVSAALVAAGGCTPPGPEASSATPCPRGQVHDLGPPTLAAGRSATFVVARGPVWFGVAEWQPLPLEDEPFRTTVRVGPRDEPPVADQGGDVASQTDRVVVVDRDWSRLDLGPGAYWVVTDHRVAGLRLQVCGDAEVDEVVPAA